MTQTYCVSISGFSTLTAPSSSETYINPWQATLSTTFTPTPSRTCVHTWRPSLSTSFTPPPAQTDVLPWPPSLTTVFTPPSQCTISLTMLEAKSFEIWDNESVPVSNETYSDCYPSAFITSYLQSLDGSTLLPAFSPLVCPQAWETVYSTSVTDGWYIACCPGKYTLSLTGTPVPTRPASGSICSSPIWSSTVVQYYNNSTYVSETTVGTSSSDGPLLAYAHPMDGLALNPPPDEDSQSNNSSLGVGVILPIIGAIFGVLWIIAFCICIVSRHRRAAPEVAPEVATRQIDRPTSTDLYGDVSVVFSTTAGNEPGPGDIGNGGVQYGGNWMGS